jgi:hypothetical protein
LKGRTAHRINTLLEQGVAKRTRTNNRFNGLHRVWKTVKTVWDHAEAINTPLKRGVNEKRTSVGGKNGEKCTLNAP